AAACGCDQHRCRAALGRPQPDPRAGAARPLTPTSLLTAPPRQERLVRLHYDARIPTKQRTHPTQPLLTRLVTPHKTGCTTRRPAPITATLPITGSPGPSRSWPDWARCGTVAATLALPE